MNASTVFTFRASPASTSCDKPVDSPTSSKRLSRKRKEFEPDFDTTSTNTLRPRPRSATMPAYEHDEKQRQELKQRQSRQTRSQTIADRLEAERVQQELDAYLDHIKNLASMIERQQQARQSHMLSVRHSSPETEVRARQSMGPTRAEHLSISTQNQNDSGENDADNEWEPFEKWKVRVHLKSTGKMYNTLAPAAASE